MGLSASVPALLAVPYSTHNACLRCPIYQLDFPFQTLNDYFAGNEDAAEGFADDNPLINSKHLEIYTHNQDELDIIVDYLQNIDFVGNVNVSSKTIKNDSFI